MHAMQDEHKKSFLEELQSLDEPTKKKVMIVATVVIMGVVIYFWLAYFNNLVAGIDQSTVAENVSSSAATASGPGLGESLRNGIASIGNVFMGIVHGLANIFQAPRQYLITPQQ